MTKEEKLKQLEKDFLKKLHKLIKGFKEHY